MRLPEHETEAMTANEELAEVEPERGFVEVEAGVASSSVAPFATLEVWRPGSGVLDTGAAVLEGSRTVALG